jgi:diacylglycerol kinase (ATP)
VTAAAEPTTDAPPAGPVAVLANPTAGRGRHRGLLPAVLDRLGTAGRAVTLLEARTAVEAQAACHTAVEGGAGALVSVGGDGTVHLAVQAVAGSGVPYAPVPAGTGNDFAHAVGLPADPLAAADAIADALRAGRTRAVDLGRITGRDGTRRWFGGVLAAGFDAIVNERANAMRWPSGPRRYDVAVFVELVRLRARHYVLDLDGERVETDAVLVAVGNIASYGGGMRMLPAADPTDGLLDVVVGAPMSRLTLARLKSHLYAGTHVDDPRVTTYRAARISIEATGITAYADGERAVDLPITVEVAPGALRLLAPL